MLVLSRKVDEAIDLQIPPESLASLAEEAAESGHPLTISVVLSQLRGDKARLGFAADARVNIIRRELLENVTAPAEEQEEVPA